MVISLPSCSRDSAGAAGNAQPDPTIAKTKIDITIETTDLKLHMILITFLLFILVSFIQYRPFLKT